MTKRRLSASALLALAWPIAAHAAPEEIQVYMDELDAPGELGLDIHNNYVLSGDVSPAYPGEQQSVHRYRITPEFSLGLSRAFELGAYLPLASIGADGTFRLQGVKLRVKYLVPRPKYSRWFYGLNFELGRVSHALDANPYNAELKGIVGTHQGKWTLAANLNFDFKVTGPAPAPATLELATKASYAISRKFALGVENYSGLGEVRALDSFGKAEQATYITTDTSIGKWDLNLGVGRGYGGNGDHWTVKAIVSVPFH